MKVTAKSQRQLRLAGAGFVLLVLGVAGLLMWLSSVYHWQADITRSGRNTLSQASIAVVKRLDKPLKITAFVNLPSERRTEISDLVRGYQRYKKNIELEFVDPNTEPERTRKAGIRYDGQLLFEYQGAKETLVSLNEETVTNVLTRLGHRGERWIVFLDGHGERSPDRQANFDLSTWAEHLRQRGFRTRALSLGESPKIPQNTSVLVIAGPQARLLSGEVKEIEKFIDRGGNLLWLNDPGPLHGLDRIAEYLGVEFQPGVIIDMQSQDLTGSASAVLVARYGAHPVVKNFHANTVFPRACGISLQAQENWRSSVLLDTRASSWSETGKLSSKISYDKGKDIPGPLNLGITLSKEQDNNQQRIAVLCDGDFLSNTFLAVAGNLDLGMSLINWLSHDDAYVSIPVRTVEDRSLKLSAGAQTLLAFVFVILLPLGLITTGVLIWLRRRKR